MPLDASTLKSRARDVIATSNPRVITVGLIYLTLTLVLNALSARVMSVNISENEAMNYLRYASEGNYASALQYAESMTPPNAAYAIYAVLTLLGGIVGAGFLIFLLNTIRGRKPCYANLLDGFGFWWKILVLRLLESLLIGLWSMLLIVPGVIAHYRYAQAIYILIDDPKKSPVQCLRESKAMMAGRKMELFRLDLSLLGWYLLAWVPYLGYLAQIWTVPYIGTVKTLYYETLTGGGNIWSYAPDYPI